jgi:hypothetical protein
VNAGLLGAPRCHGLVAFEHHDRLFPAKSAQSILQIGIRIVTMVSKPQGL